MAIRESLKIYTVEKANKALPLVNRIVVDVQLAYKKFKDAELKGNSETVEMARNELVSLLDELNDLGAELKGFEEGLVDFYAKKDGKLVYLCWKLGENKVSHWHELQAGFAGRESIEGVNFDNKS